MRENFDLTPAGIIKSLDLRKPIYRQTSTYGHFGRNEKGFNWEKTDKAGLLQEKMGRIGYASSLKLFLKRKFMEENNL